MMPGLTMVNFECKGIEEVAREAQRIADLTDRSVGFEFNSVRCVAWPGGSAEKLAELQQEAQRHQLVVYSNSGSIEIEREFEA
jgi:hypothetical protein